MIFEIAGYFITAAVSSATLSCYLAVILVAYFSTSRCLPTVTGFHRRNIAKSVSHLSASTALLPTQL